MSRKILHELLSIEDTRQLFGAIDVGTRVRSVLIENSTGGILAEDIVSVVDVPNFPKALKDGFAVRLEDVSAAKLPVKLKLLGFSPVGELPGYHVGRMEAVEVATGGPIPEGADAVVMVEDTEIQEGYVIIKAEVRLDENLIHAGFDISKGETVLRKGTRIGPRQIGVLAAIGMRSVDIRFMKVGIVSTGNELTLPGEVLGPGRIYDCNSYSLHAGVTNCGVDAVAYGIVRDEREAFNEAVSRAVEECDLVLTSGSTSAGPDDFMVNIIEDKGEVLAHGLNFKPGKPVIVGIVNNIPIVALPGNPTSSLMVFYEFLMPLIRRCTGVTPPVTQSLEAFLEEDVYSGSRHELHAVWLEGDRVHSASKTSASITTLASAVGFIVIPADVQMVKKGCRVEVVLFEDGYV